MTLKATATGTDGENLEDRVSVALTTSDKRELKRAAFHSDTSTSAFIRAAALRAARRTNEAAKKAA